MVPMDFPFENTVKVQSASEGCFGKEPVGDFPLSINWFCEFCRFCEKRKNGKVKDLD